MLPTERRAWVYKIAECNGGTVDWETGEVSYESTKSNGN